MLLGSYKKKCLKMLASMSFGLWKSHFYLPVRSSLDLYHDLYNHTTNIHGRYKDSTQQTWVKC